MKPFLRSLDIRKNKTGFFSVHFLQSELKKQWMQLHFEIVYSRKLSWKICEWKNKRFLSAEMQYGSSGANGLKILE